MGHHQLDKLDEQILQLIAENARIPFLEVARVCNVSGAAIHQRIQKLTNLGILKGSEFVIDPESIGYLEEYYGIQYDHNRFFVDYQPVGRNIMPEITVICKKEGWYR